MRVQAIPEVRQYLRELSQILYDKEYFGFLHSAEKYVDELFEEIKTTLSNKLKRPAPTHFERYGKKMLYCAFRKNKTTQWYVFFNIYQDGDEFVYVIRYISNNHMDAHRF